MTELLTNLNECLAAPVKKVLAAMAEANATTVRLTIDARGKPLAGIIFVTGDKTEAVLKAVENVEDA